MVDLTWFIASLTTDLCYIVGWLQIRDNDNEGCFSVVYNNNSNTHKKQS